MTINNQTRDFAAEANALVHAEKLDIRGWRGDHFDQRLYCTRCTKGGWSFKAASDAVHHVDMQHA